MRLLNTEHFTDVLVILSHIYVYVHPSDKELIYTLNIFRVSMSTEMTAINIWRYPEGKLHHEFCTAVYKFIEVRGREDVFWTACCKASHICFIMFMSEGIGDGSA